MKLTVMDRILDTSGRRSKGHKAVAAFLEAHTDKAVFMNAAQIAQAVGVSESTVVRFATAIGYDGVKRICACEYGDICCGGRRSRM